MKVMRAYLVVLFLSDYHLWQVNKNNKSFFVVEFNGGELKNETYSVWYWN